ncbi:hypothetical protein C8J56DRAFT_896348 [Mycena floridula]|nr:hypothetical protein C8J56DRAFT_897210 [Mycena floridula]KAJ7580343.1 hypothetical protein C8J56DRAFT_896348 [Mycena floridula]
MCFVILGYRGAFCHTDGIGARIHQVQDLNNGGMYGKVKARVVSGHRGKHTLLIYAKNGRNEAIYAISGSVDAPTVAFQSLKTIIHNNLPPSPDVRHITISNEAAFDVSIYVAPDPKAVFPGSLSSKLGIRMLFLTS